MNGAMPVGAPGLLPLMTLAQAHALLPGATLFGDGATSLGRVHSDSRTLQSGDLFVALAGERFDGHDFLPQARAAGAVAAIATRGLAEAGLPGLRVDDTLVALQQLAAGWRASHPLPIVAVAGSNGKTTVTQMVAAILRAWVGEAALATAGNLNNHIGLPLTLLRLRPEHRVAVVELGMNHVGEIALLAGLARPDVVVMTNAQREHQEFMASVEAVAHENGEAILALPAKGVAVYPADDEQAPLWHAQAGSRAQLTFALHGQADVVDEALWVADESEAGHAGGLGGHWALRVVTPAGRAEFSLHVAGLHNVRNALAATAAALAVGVPLSQVVAGLEAFRAVSGRSQAQPLRRRGRVVTLVDDSYNANPDSVRAAAQLLAGLPGPHWLLLGDMGEVGDQGPAFHAEVGAFARDAGIAALWCVGPQSAAAARAFGSGARHFAQVEALIAALDSGPDCGALLVKGSRYMRMERVVQALRGAAEVAATTAPAPSGTGGRDAA